MLKAENEDLRRRLKAAITTPVVLPAAVVPQSEVPPPTPPPVAALPPQPEEEGDGDISGPLVAPLRQKQVQSLWLEVARNVMQRVKRLAFRDPVRKREVDSLTFHLNRQYEDDRARAEIELFGEELPPEAWNNIEEEEYFDKIHQIDLVVEKYVRERVVAGKEEKEKEQK